MPFQVLPPSVVRATDPQCAFEHGALPSTQPSSALTKVDEYGVKPVGTGPLDGPTGADVRWFASELREIAVAGDAGFAGADPDAAEPAAPETDAAPVTDVPGPDGDPEGPDPAPFPDEAEHADTRARPVAIAMTHLNR